MANIDDIIRTLDELLRPTDFQDLGPNGLQVPGANEVTRVLTGVSATLELHERAVELGAELVLVHHGLFWNFHPAGLTPLLAARLRPLFKHDINLAGYHLPLDAHPEVGNNAILARELGCVEIEPFGAYKGTFIGRRGTFAEPLTASELHERVHEVTGRRAAAAGRRAGADRLDRHRLGFCRGHAQRGRRGGPGRVPDRRAAGAHHGRGGGTPRPLRGGRPSRHGDLRRQSSRRTTGGPICGRTRLLRSAKPGLIECLVQVEQEAIVDIR